MLSAVLGHMAPLLLPPVYTHYAAVLLFLIFGVKMLNESREASAGVSDELEEVRRARKRATAVVSGGRVDEVTKGTGRAGEGCPEDGRSAHRKPLPARAPRSSRSWRGTRSRRVPRMTL